MDWSYELLICFSAYSYDEIEEKAKTLRRSASHTATDDVSGIILPHVAESECIKFNFRLFSTYGRGTSRKV